MKRESYGLVPWRKQGFAKMTGISGGFLASPQRRALIEASTHATGAQTHRPRVPSGMCEPLPTAQTTPRPPLGQRGEHTKRKSLARVNKPEARLCDFAFVPAFPNMNDNPAVGLYTSFDNGQSSPLRHPTTKTVPRDPGTDSTAANELRARIKRMENSKQRALLELPVSKPPCRRVVPLPTPAPFPPFSRTITPVPPAARELQPQFYQWAQPSGCPSARRAEVSLLETFRMDRPLVES
ncbi:hypothetical protein DIPPA_21703 [Diplonema papillatum]|nr:hypothetical protein DIPPA_21703 [Diplonema papillatum]